MFEILCSKKIEELELVTASIYLAFAEENLYDCIQLDKRAAWEKMTENDCRDFFKADAIPSFFPQSCCSIHKKHDKLERGSFKEECRCTTSPIYPNIALQTQNL